MSVKSPMRTVCVHLPIGIIEFMEEEIKLGNYSSKADVMRYALRRLRDTLLD